MENTFGMNIIPDNDEQRILALKRYHILDTPPEGAFDNIAKLATEIFDVPISLISLVDAEQVFFKANIGMGNAKVTSRGVSLCSLAVLKPGVTLFENALEEPCLLANPNVAGSFGLKFYAGAPLTTHDGFHIGTLCIIDKTPRAFGGKEEKILEGLAKIVMDEIELRLAAITETDNLQEANEELSVMNEEMTVVNEEIRTANEELLVTRDNLLRSLDDLKTSEERFRTLVAQAPVAITIYNGADLIIEQANSAMLHLWGQTERVIGMPLLVARPELSGHPYLDIIREVFNTGREHTGFAVKGPVRLNNEIIEGYFDVTYKPITSENGQVTGLIVVATDVTDKIEARQRELDLNEELASINEEMAASNEELRSSQEYLTEVNHELSESEGRFRSLIEQSPVAIATLKGRELVIDCVNEMILKIWGKDQSVVGKPLHTALPELQDQPFLQILDDVYTSGKPFYGSEAKVMLEQEGRLTDLFVNFVYQPIYQKDGTTSDIMVVANDVTEQVNSRLVLKEKNEELSLLAEQLAYVSNTIPQQVWTATPDGLLDFVNEQTIQYFGKTAAELLGANWAKVVHPDDLESAGKAWVHALATGEPYQTEFRLLSKEGSYAWHLARATAYSEDGKIGKWFGTNTNIDSHKRLEQHKTDFISIASHELKTPITSLKASLQLLHRMKDQPVMTILPKLIDQANRGIIKISSLVDDLLSVSRMSEGQVHVNKTTFCVGALLAVWCEHVTVEGKYTIVIEGELKTEVFADEHLIEQVVVNLVNNAIKYAPDSLEIRLVISEKTNAVKIEVIDAGPGIPAEKVPHLFDRYYRADHSGKQYSGLGLGLYICAEIIQRHGGTIGVDSEIGKGTKFWFEIPK